MWSRLMEKMRNWWNPTKPSREVFLYNGVGSGKDQIGSPVLVDGKRGKVVAGTVLTITVEWECRLQIDYAKSTGNQVVYLYRETM